MRLIDLYQQYKLSNRRLRSEATDRVYLIAIRQLAAAIGHEPRIADLTDESLRKLEFFLRDRAPPTINERTGRIKALWRWFAKQGGITRWPTLDRLPQGDPYRRAWTVVEVHKLLATTAQMCGKYAGVPASLWWNCFLRMLWDTGERAGATRAMQFDWLTDTGCILVPADARKGRKAAVYQLSASTVSAIDQIRLPPRELLFPWPLSDASFYLHYGRLLLLAGLPNNRKSKAQRMRRTHLTYWCIGGGDPTMRAKHVSRATTDMFYLDETMLPQPHPDDYLPPLD